MRQSAEAGLLVLPVVSVLAGWMPAQLSTQGSSAVLGGPPPTAPYEALTNDPASR